MSGGKIFRKFLIFLCLAALMLTGCTSAKTEEAAQQETDGKEENGETTEKKKGRFGKKKNK